MKNLSSETCQRLKEAGFLQPEKAPGQLWYYNEELFLFYPMGDVVLPTSMEDGLHYLTTEPEGWVYCPTALELLSLLPEWDLCAFHDGMPFDWQLYSTSIFVDNVYNETNDSLLDRIAEIWLSENEQK